MVKVSICIPAYKQPEMLKRCLESILAQTCADYEVIISDDTPDDSVSRTVDAYRDKKQIRYYHNVAQLGTPENWNGAMRKAVGEYIILLHHDDWFYHENTLVKMVHAAENTSADLVFAQSYNVSSDGVIRTKNNPDNRKISRIRSDKRTLFYHNWIGAPSAVLFKNKGLYFDSRLKWLVDLEFYMRQIGTGGIYYVPEAIVGIGLGSSQATQMCFGNPDVEIPENILVYNSLVFRWELLFRDFIHFFRIFFRLGTPRKQLALYHPPASVFFFHLLSLPFIISKRIYKIIRRK